MEKEKEKQKSDLLTEREKIELRKEAYHLSFRIPFTNTDEEKFGTYGKWISYKSKEI